MQSSVMKYRVECNSVLCPGAILSALGFFFDRSLNFYHLGQILTLPFEPPQSKKATSFANSPSLPSSSLLQHVHPCALAMLLVLGDASANKCGHCIFMNGIGQTLLSGTNIILRRPTRSALGTILVVLYLYFFTFRSPTESVARIPRSVQPHLEGIPPRIWQIFFDHDRLDDYAPALQTWILMNQGYTYTLMRSKGADEFVRKHYADRPDVLEPFLQLKLPVLRSDLLRYMLLESEGGVYSDLDTVVVRSVRDWIPRGMRSKVRAIIGVEYDQLDGEPYHGMSERIQFCQWTMAASRGHPIMQKVVKKVVAALNETAVSTATTIADFSPSDHEVLKVSGPIIWTHAVMEGLSEATGTAVSYLNITGMTEPRLFGDILVLPIDAFGGGQVHSNSTREGPGDFFVRHQWKGFWKQRRKYLDL